jgi:hypothetical protein
MLEELLVKASALSKRQVITRAGVLVFGLVALALWVLQQAYLFHSPRYSRLRPAFLVLDIFTLSWIIVGPVLWKWAQRNQPAGK